MQPKILAMATPHKFWMISMIEETTNRIAMAMPPFLITFRLALNPMVEKKAIMKKSFRVWSNTNSKAPVWTPIRLTTENSKPPTAGAGMQ